MSDTTHRPYTPPDDPRLPRFSSREEEAHFWDTHDLFDLSPIEPDEADPPHTVRRAAADRRRGFTEQLTVRLDRETYEAIQAEARELGIGPTTLVRIWLRDRVRAR